MKSWGEGAVASPHRTSRHVFVPLVVGNDGRDAATIQEHSLI